MCHIKIIMRVFAVTLMAWVLAGCGAGAPGDPELTTQDKIAALTQVIAAQGSDVDPAEAARAARISITYAHQLSVEYGVTDPPLVHNMKVNAGTRPRGLCWHWADDMETRLRAENFRTLVLHRAIANANNLFRIEHSTVVITPQGVDVMEGVVLDPWRYGGRLYWGKVRADHSYKWQPRADVFATRQRRGAAR